MSDISDCIIKILADNGVSVEQTDIWKDNGLVRNVKSIIELDFSEHDKVFEDKIVELKKDYKTASELLGKYQQENEALKKRIQELDTIDAMRIDEKRELKQRIDELEKELEEWKAEAREIKKHRDEQLKSFRKGIEPYVDLSHMHETIAELKQHIAELESKEDEKSTKYTTVIVAKEINGQTYVTLDDFMSVVNDLQAEIGT